LVAFALPVLWRLAVSVHESRLVLESRELSAGSAANLSAESDGAPLAGAALALLERLAPGEQFVPADEGPFVVPFFEEPPISVRVLEPRKLLAICRGWDAATVQRRCERLATSARSSEDVFQVNGAPTASHQSMPIASWPALLAGVGAGALTGLLWMALYAAWLGARSQPSQSRSAPVVSPQAAHNSASDPPAPARILMVAPAYTGTAGDATQGLPSTFERSRTIEMFGGAASGGLVPSGAAKASPATPAVKSDAVGPVETTLQTLCSQLCLLSARGCFVLGVSSWLESRDAKHAVAMQLASALAERQGPRVLLLEADFDDPAVDRVARVVVPSLGGFSQQMYLRGSGATSGPWTVVRSGSRLDVLAEGRVRTPGTLSSGRFSAALTDLRRRYDIIVADGPIFHSEADVRALGGLCDGIVFIASSRITLATTIATTSTWFASKQLFAIVASAGLKE
jgi:Mrp family chromosome partitioning ATPase